VSAREVEQLQAEVDYYRDRAALLRAKLYRWGVGKNGQLERFERELERAEQRLRNARGGAKRSLRAARLV
jgi:prefoldin subunit 5